MKKNRILKGCVISNKMKKSIVVIIQHKIKHSIYKKYIKRTSKFYVHDENNECNIGDIIKFKESKPISKTKFWILIKIIKKNLLNN
ncbi:MAG: 30S ribosomal protein S17 [Enterobacteriaceae bacterium PC38]|nr:MAG: 30S ribosomal protein S17 [Enterobacteriaceae bacterium PC38]